MIEGGTKTTLPNSELVLSNDYLSAINPTFTFPDEQASTQQCQFLPRDATQSAVMRQYTFCLSVCLSVRPRRLGTVIT